MLAVLDIQDSKHGKVFESTSTTNVESQKESGAGGAVSDKYEQPCPGETHLGRREDSIASSHHERLYLGDGVSINLLSDEDLAHAEPQEEVRTDAIRAQH